MHIPSPKRNTLNKYRSTGTQGNSRVPSTNWRNSILELLFVIICAAPGKGCSRTSETTGDCLLLPDLASRCPFLSFNLKFSSFHSLVFTLLLYIYPPLVYLPSWRQQYFRLCFIVWTSQGFYSAFWYNKWSIVSRPNRPDSPSVGLLQVELIAVWCEWCTLFSLCFVNTSKYVVNTSLAILSACIYLINSSIILVARS